MFMQRERKMEEFPSALTPQQKRLLEKLRTLQFTLLLLVADVAAAVAAD
jgi:hypothetical protein